MAWPTLSADWLVSRRTPLELRRRLLPVGPGRLGIAQEFVAPTEHEARLATAHNWLASLVIRQAGAIGFRDGRGLRQIPGDRFLLYLPPGSLVRMQLGAARVETIGISATEPQPGFPQVALAIPCQLEREQALDLQALSTILAGSRLPDRPQASDPQHRIDADLGLPLRLRRLRGALYDHALSPAAIGRVAREHGYAPAVLSRSFTDAYGLTPRDYLQKVRVHAAVVSLFGGLSIAHAALDSGWGDLSRFYRQFRLATGQTPGRYRAAFVHSQRRPLAPSNDRPQTVK